VPIQEIVLTPLNKTRDFFDPFDFFDFRSLNRGYCSVERPDLESQATDWAPLGTVAIPNFFGVFDPLILLPHAKAPRRKGGCALAKGFHLVVPRQETVLTIKEHS